jgi:hypothetical protein
LEPVRGRNRRPRACVRLARIERLVWLRLRERLRPLEQLNQALAHIGQAEMAYDARARDLADWA